MQKYFLFCFFVILMAINVYGQEKRKRSKKQKFYDEYWQEQALLEKYNQQIKTATNYFKENKYLQAVNAYSEALKIKDGDQQAQAKIYDIEVILASLDADSLITAKPLSISAIIPVEENKVKEVSEVESPLISTEDKPLDKPKKTEKKQASKVVEPIVIQEPKNPEIIKTIDKSSTIYRKALAEKYKENEELNYIEGNRQITKRIVVKPPLADEYLRVTHNWGGVYYFKNGESITKQTWIAETDDYFKVK